MPRTEDKDFRPVSVIRQPTDLAPYIDHTLLKADATSIDIRKLCSEARVHEFKAVCVNPVFVALTRELLNDTNVITASVIGFPLGASLSVAKVRETELAIQDGATEIDMVLRLDLAKENRWKEAEADIAAVVRATKGAAAVKVILETGLLTNEQISSACRISETAGAAFVKTSTGFLGRGATIEDVKLMRRSCALEIKASGGVKTFAQALALIETGATRLGTSSGVALVTMTSGESDPTY